MWLYYFWSLLPRWGWAMVGIVFMILHVSQLLEVSASDPAWIFVGWILLLVAIVLATIMACLWPEERHDSG